MVHGEAEVAELEPEAFEFMERFYADVDIDLFSKTVVSVVSGKHHCHPVIAGVTHNLFRAIATYNIHTIDFSCRTFIGQTLGLPRATKNRYGLMGEKRDTTFHLRVLRYRFRPRSIPSRNYKKKK